MDKPFAMTVSQLNDYVKALIDSSEVLSNVCIVGEISNFTNHYKTGHLYFTLKDEGEGSGAVHRPHSAVCDGKRIRADLPDRSFLGRCGARDRIFL